MAITWKTERRKVKDLKDYPKNPRTFTEKGLADLKASFRSLGYIDPIAINLDGTIIGGHARKSVLLELGIKEIDVRVPNVLLSDRLVEEAIIRLNKNIAGNWDFKILEDSFNQTDLIDWGFEKAEFNSFSSRNSAAVEIAPPLRKTAITKAGDIWVMGKHRLMCGDATDKQALGMLMGSHKADMVFTDPPYRMEAEGGSAQPIGRAAAKLGEAIKHLCDFDPDAFLDALPSLFSKGLMNAYIFCNKDLVPDYINWALAKGYAFNILFWKKPNAIPLGGSHRPDVEYLLFFRKGAIWNNAVAGVSYSKCLEYMREHSEEHPTMKPVELIANEIRISSNKNSIVADPFGGAGSTLMACETTDRQARLMEIDPCYCDIIVRRWEKFTGEIAINENTGRTFGEHEGKRKGAA
jgi:DNA modification methylase